MSSEAETSAVQFQPNAGLGLSPLQAAHLSGIMVINLTRQIDHEEM
jgi:hypothetical protein